MEDDKYHRLHKGKPLVNRSYFFFCIILALLGGGCKSTRHTLEETHGEIHSSIKESLKGDTLHSTTATREEDTDTAEIRTHASALTCLKRDSAGRIIEIRKEKITSVKANQSRKTELDSRIYEIKAARKSEVADSMVSINKKEKGSESKAKIGIPTECIIGWSLVIIMILLYAGDWIYRIWKKRK